MECLRQEAADPRAEQVLKEAYQDLQERAARLSDSLRQAYLKNVPANRELTRLWQARPSWRYSGCPIY